MTQTKPAPTKTKHNKVKGRKKKKKTTKPHGVSFEQARNTQHMLTDMYAGL